MDPLSIVAGIAGVFAISSAALQISKEIALSQQHVLVQRFGWPLGVFISLVLRDTANRYERIEEEVLNGTDEDALAFKQSVTDECNMTAVAGAIIAQIAITGLSLPNLSPTHWIARAFFLTGVTSGCLSVYYACVLQRTVGKLYRPDTIRYWLRSPPPSEKDGGSDTAKTSLPAVFILSAPFVTVKVSIFSFLTGLAIYQGFTWTRDLDATAGQHDSRNVFITFIVGTGVCFLFFWATFMAKGIESLLRIGRTMSGSSKSQREEAVRDKEQMGFTTTESSLPPMTRSPVNPEIHASNSSDRATFRDLAAALDTAAQAHIQCAEANHRVGIEYAKMFNMQPNHAA